ncbi:MAG: cyclic pyranopterin phosphate synthase MoaA [Anaerocolumna sp.]|nr:cyclic pyranopterin phosphate synthase MoaA [Anaerocolumna sp.]
MIDEYGRGIDYIRISVTDRCNLRCVYCMPKEGVDFLPHSKILTYEEIIRLCKCFAALGIHKVKITGGEPLVRKDLPYLIKQIKEIPGIENVTITTNGILLVEQIEDLVNAGVDSMNISLDTLDREQFREVTRFDLLDKVVAGLKEALKYPDLTVKINCVPICQKNEEEAVLSMVALAKDTNVHVRFIELMPIGLGKELSGYTEDSIKNMIEQRYGKLTLYRKTLGNGPCSYYSLEGFQGKIGFISAMSHKFCDTCNRVRLTSDGCLKNCLQYSVGTDLKQRMEQGISDEELREVIQSSIMKKPKAHQFGEIEEPDNNEVSLEERRMSQIGG